MNDRNRRNGDNGGNNGGDGGWSWWDVAAGVTGAAIGVGLYRMLQSSDPQASTSQDEQQNENNSFSFSNMLEHVASAAQRDESSNIETSRSMEDIISLCSVPSQPHITNLNSLLHDIYVRYIAIKKEEFERYYKVHTAFVFELHKKMKEVDKYYQRYSSGAKFAGSHYDNVRTTKPDEFDMVFIIGVPVNTRVDPYKPEESDIVIEQKYPGYVQLRAGTQYKNILIRDGADSVINKTAYLWLDDKDYILRSKFISWFKSVGTRALNKFPKNGSTTLFYVDGIEYEISTTESGPAWTLIVEASGFKLDIDLVPALRFPESRWPVGKMYRSIPAECKRDYWIVVPKPNKKGSNAHDEWRSWRIGLQDQETQLFKNTYALRQTIRFTKKLRDALGMKNIASYYIKTIFFWEIIQLKNTDPWFWKTNDITTLFKYMLEKFYTALDDEKILYFWNRNYNFIELVNRSVLMEYKNKVLNLLNLLETPAKNRVYYLDVAKHLLTPSEYSDYIKILN